MEEAYKNRDNTTKTMPAIYAHGGSENSTLSINDKSSFQSQSLGTQAGILDLMGLSPDVIPYNFFKKQLEEDQRR
jgi:hypothetical protein